MIKAFLFKTVYRNTQMMELRREADRVLRELFSHFFAHPDELPSDWRLAPEQMAASVSVARAICDFIAGMTDRYALNMHARLFDDTPDLRYGAAI
jgi:dGTPase